VAARVTLGAAAAGFWALGLWRNSEVVEALNDAEAAYEKYSSPRRTQSDYDRHWRTYAEANDRADEAAGARNVAYTVGGVFSAGFFLTFLF
jgi:glycerol kinase